jgi:hypothetical protein
MPLTNLFNMAVMSYPSAYTELDFMEYATDAAAQSAYKTNATYSLQSFSEASIKTQGSYSLKGVATTDSSGKILTKTISSLNLGTASTIKFDIRESRTGSTIKLGLENNNKISNADIDNEDMADITDWTEQNGVNGDVSQVTFDSKSCMKLDSGNEHASGSSAGALKHYASFGARTVVSFSVYCDTLEVRANTNMFRISLWNGTQELGISFCDDGLFIVDTNWVNQGDWVVADTWQEWTFDITWTAQTLDIYLDKVLKKSGATFEQADATTAGTLFLAQAGYTTDNRISYVDWLKAGSDMTYTTTELTPTINSADTFEAQTWDISGVAAANKNNITSIIVTVTEATTTNTFYIDNMRYK